MLRTTLSLAFGSMWVLFAEAAAPVPAIPFLSDYGNLTALGILAVVVIWLVTKHLPAQQREVRDISTLFADTTKGLLENFTTTLDRMHSRADAWEKVRHDDAQELAGALRQLASNCAATHGLNSTPMGQHGRSEAARGP